MKVAVKNYTFDKTAKTITFTDYGSIRLDSILLIVNVTTGNTIIYNFADNSRGGTVATNVLTLAFDTSSMNNTDKLLIFYEDAAVIGDVGSLTETAPTTDTASSGLNGRLQRIAQRITSLIALLPTALGAGGGLKIDGSGTALPIDSELPAAAALADGAANPTTPTVGSANLVFNGTTWDRLDSIVAGLNSTGGGIPSAGLVGQLDDVSTASVTENQFAPVRISTRRALLVEGVASGTNINNNTAQINGVTVLMGNGASGTGAQRVTIANDSTGILATVGTVTNLAQMNGVAITMGNGASGTGVQRVTLASDSTGNIATIGTSVTPGVSAGHLGKAEDAVAGSGDTGVAVWGVRRDAPATNVNAAGDYAELAISGQGAMWTSLTPSVGGGWSKVSYLAQTTTVRTPKGTAATWGGYYIYNPNTVVSYVQIFDAATATTITLGTTAPDLSLAIPPGSAANIEFSNGIAFANGIKLACTTTATGSTAPTTGLDLNIYFK